MQCSINEEGALRKPRSSSVNEATLMQRCSHEDRRCRETMVRRAPW